MAKFSQYSTFVAVVETGSLSAAAKRLNITPSAISKQLNALETATKVQLFDRSHRNVKVTEPGQRFYHQCKSILSAVSQAEDELLNEQDAVSGRLSVTLSKSLIRSPLLKAFSNFTDAYPEICIDITASEILEDLHEEGLDFAFRLGRLGDSSRLYAKPLTDVRLTFCATPNYLNKYGTPQSYSDLQNHKIMLVSPETLSDEMKSYVNRENLKMNASYNHFTNDIEAMYQAIRADMCIGLQLDLSIQQELADGIFKELFPDKRMPSKKLYLIYKKSGRFLQKQSAFKAFMIDYFRQTR